LRKRIKEKFLFSKCYERKVFCGSVRLWDGKNLLEEFRKYPVAFKA
jgi:hypothetical protein